MKFSVPNPIFMYVILLLPVPINKLLKSYTLQTVYIDHYLIIKIIKKLSATNSN